MSIFKDSCTSVCERDCWK